MIMSDLEIAPRRRLSLSSIICNSDIPPYLCYSYQRLLMYMGLTCGHLFRWIYSAQWKTIMCFVSYIYALVWVHRGSNSSRETCDARPRVPSIVPIHLFIFTAVYYMAYFWAGKCLEISGLVSVCQETICCLVDLHWFSFCNACAQAWCQKPNQRRHQLFMRRWSGHQNMCYSVSKWLGACYSSCIGWRQFVALETRCDLWRSTNRSASSGFAWLIISKDSTCTAN